MNLKELDIAVTQQLKEKFEKDFTFKQELDNFIHFYGRKFMQKAKTSQQEDLIQNTIPDLVKTQFYQGYFIMTSLLSDEKLVLEQEIWTLNPGVIRNEIPILFNKIFEEQKNEWYQTELGKKIGMQLITELDDIYDLLKQTRLDCAFFGAYKAFLNDVRYEKEIENNELLLGNPFDLAFLNPQVYMKAQLFSNEQEVWDIYSWSSFEGQGSWIGSIHFATIPNDEQTLFLLSFSILDTIIIDEIYQMLEIVISRLSDDMKASTQIRVYRVSDMSVEIPK